VARKIPAGSEGRLLYLVFRHTVEYLMKAIKTAGGGRGAVGSAATKGEGGLSRSALIGTSWLLVQNAGTRVISFGSQIILAKLLAPSDFGNIGLALTVTTLASVVANFGVDDVLLQRQRTLRFWASPAFVTSLGLGLFSFLAVVGIAPLAALIYRSPILLSILPLMALALPLTALSTVPTAQIRARLDFGFWRLTRLSNWQSRSS